MTQPRASEPIETVRYEQRHPRPNRSRSAESYPLRAKVTTIPTLDSPPMFKAVVWYEHADGTVTSTQRRFHNPSEARGFAKRSLQSYHPKRKRNAR